MKHISKSLDDKDIEIPFRLIDWTFISDPLESVPMNTRGLVRVGTSLPASAHLIESKRCLPAMTTTHPHRQWPSSWLGSR
jgi:hypothetical protein